MPTNDASTRLLDEETGKNLLLSRIPGYSYQKVYNVYKQHPSITTVAEFKKHYERMVSERISKRSTAASKLWKTPYGTLTTIQIHARHDHKEDISLALLSNRLSKRGGMCPSLWWPKMHGSQFRVRLVKEGIIEANWTNHRPDDQTNDDAVNCPTSHSNRRDQKINRLETCFRDKGRIRCKHYQKRLDRYTGHPEECDVACNDSCSNFDGEVLEARLDCSGRSPRHFKLNGTSTEGFAI